MRGGRKSESLREREIDRERESECMEAAAVTAARSGGLGVEWRLEPKKKKKKKSPPSLEKDGLRERDG